MRTARPGRGARVGWTLIETVVAAAVLAVLTGLVLAGVQKVRSTAARAACANSLRQLAVATHAYSNQRQHLPQGCSYPFATPDSPYTRQVGLSWHTAILPYVEQASLWDLAWQANQAAPGGGTAAHAGVMGTTVRPFVCPADSRPAGEDGLGGRWALTSYVGVAGTGVYSNNGMLHPNHTVRMTDVTDGLSCTVLIGERPAGPGGRYGGWYANWGNCTCPAAQLLPVHTVGPLIADGTACAASLPLAPGTPTDPCAVFHYWSLHPGGANFAFGDGSVRFLRYEAAPLLPALATRAGNEPTTDLE